MHANAACGVHRVQAVQVMSGICWPGMVQLMQRVHSVLCMRSACIRRVCAGISTGAGARCWSECYGSGSAGAYASDSRGQGSRATQHVDDLEAGARNDVQEGSVRNSASTSTWVNRVQGAGCLRGDDDNTHPKWWWHQTRARKSLWSEKEQRMHRGLRWKLHQSYPTV